MENSEGPELKVKYSVDLSGVKQGSAEVKKEVAAVASEAEKASKSGEKLAEALDDVKKESKELAPEVQKVTKEAKSMSESMDKATGSAKSLSPEIGKSTSSTKSLMEMVGKASAIAGGTFVSAALAMGSAIAAANTQVSELDHSVKVSSGSQENYATNMASLEGIADKYKLSIFNIAASFNELTRETRGTINEGQPTAQIFDTLTNVSKKLKISVDDTTGSFTGFIDRMKQGTVDSTGLSNEIDQRLYEAFTKVARGMGITNDELNEVLKTSDEAVATVLPKLAEQLSVSLGEIPQKDAKDLGDSVDYATGKMTLLLDALFKTSGAKSFLAQAAEDAGDLMGQLTVLAEDKGVKGVALGMLDAIMSNGPGEGVALKYASTKIDTGNQRKSLSLNDKYNNGNLIGWNKQSPYEGPFIGTKKEFDIISAAEENRRQEEEKLNKKRIADAKRQASERKKALDDIVKTEIYESNQRIKEQILAMNIALNEAYGKNNGIIGPIRQIQKIGVTTGFNNDLKRTQSFTNPTTGDGSALNFDRVNAGIDGVIDGIKTKYATMQAAISGGMDETIERINENLTQALRNAATTAAVGIGESIGEALATSGEGLEDSGKKFGLMIAGLLKDLGGALVAAATLKIAADKSLFGGNAPAALAIGMAAVAAGAYLQTKMNNAGQKFYTGGFVRGRAGVDNVPIWASPGELVLNQGQQSNLLSAINGTMTSADYGSGPMLTGGAGQRESIRVVVEGHLRNDRIEISNRRGARSNRYFE